MNGEIAPLIIKASPIGWREAEQEIKKVEQTARNMGKSFDELANDAHDAATAITGAGNAAKKTKKDFTDMFRELLNAREGLAGIAGGFLRIGTGTYLLQRAFQTTTGVIKSIVGPAMDAAASFEQMTMAYKVLAETPAGGMGLLQYIKDLSLEVPISIEAFDKANRTLLGFGFTSKEVESVLLRLADVTQGNSENFSHLALVYGQVLAQGKAMQQDIYQFVNAGIPIMEALADVIGKPTSAIRELIREGEIGLPEFEQALNNLTAPGGAFYDFSRQAASTFRGEMERAASATKQILAEIGKGINPVVTFVVRNVREQTQQTLEDLQLAKIYGGQATPQEQEQAFQIYLRRRAELAEPGARERMGVSYGFNEMQVNQLTPIFEALGFGRSQLGRSRENVAHIRTAEEWGQEALRQLQERTGKLFDPNQQKLMGLNSELEVNKEYNKIVREIANDLVDKSPMLIRQNRLTDTPGFDITPKSPEVQALLGLLRPETKAELGDKIKNLKDDILVGIFTQFEADIAETRAKLGGQLTPDDLGKIFLGARGKIAEAYVKASYGEYDMSGAFSEGAAQSALAAKASDLKVPTYVTTGGDMGPMFDPEKLKEIADIWDNMWESIGKGATDTTISTFVEVMQGLGAGTLDAADAFNKYIATITSQMAPLFIRAGLEMIAKGTPETIGLGIVLLGLGGISALASGYYGAQGEQGVRYDYGALATTVNPYGTNVGSFANGGVFNSPSLHSYANGVYNSPRFFAFANGGVFGEAGPEAIMPLARGSDGKLGVRASSSTSIIVQNFDMSNRGVSITQEESTGPNGEKVIRNLIRDLVADDLASGRLDKALRSRNVMAGGARARS